MKNELDLIAELRRHNLLTPLLQRQVIAECVKGEDLSEEEISHAHQLFMKNNNIDSDNALKSFLAKQGWSTEDFQWQACLTMRIRKYCTKQFQHKTEAYFLKHKNQLDQVVYSLIRVRDMYLAKELYWRIEAGESNFGDLAASFSEGPERATKGVVGPVPMSQAHPALSEALRISRPGVLLNPMQIGEWSIVARLETYKPATFNESMAARLSQELFDKWINEEVDRRMSRSGEKGVIGGRHDKQHD